MTRERAPFTSLFQELKRLVRPDAGDFNGARAGTIVEQRKDIFDGTAPWALEQLASGLHSHLTSPIEPWFDLTVAGIPHDELDWDARQWLQFVTDEIYAAYSDSFGSFAPSVHECYLDIGAFGTGVLYQWYDAKFQTVCFRTYPLSDVLIREDAYGRIDTVHRSVLLTVRQVRGEFGALPEKLNKLQEDQQVTVVHCVYPRTDRDSSRLTPTSKPWASAYICKDTEETILESGYDFMPYHASRWTKLAGEMYGRSPAMSVLPEIRMVNAMSRSMIVAAQKLVEPALQVPDDSFLLPLRTTPGAVNYRRPGSDPIEPMPGPQDIAVTAEMIEQRRDTIRRGLFVDWLVRPMKKERQTASEIMDERNQMLGMLGPVVGRLQAELLGPCLRHTYNLLSRHRRLPPAPASLGDSSLDIRYTSPAAKAQSTTRGQGVMQFVQQLVQLQPVLPEITDVLDEKGLVAEIADLTDVAQRVIARPDVIESKRNSRKEQQDLANAAQVAPAAAKATKDYASAAQMIPGLM